MSDVLLQLQDWYERQCNEEWEHFNGVSVQTLDNPGWLIKIDLKGTDLETQDFNPIVTERSDTDWIDCKRDDKQFVGTGGARNLIELLGVFLAWQANSQGSRSSK